jgi:hypothetical protein
VVIYTSGLRAKHDVIGKTACKSIDHFLMADSSNQRDTLSINDWSTVRQEGKTSSGACKLNFKDIVEIGSNNCRSQLLANLIS